VVSAAAAVAEAASEALASAPRRRQDVEMVRGQAQSSRQTADETGACEYAAERVRIVEARIIGHG
jgi:hypothetical protein